jgi:hypothetical protein
MRVWIASRRGGNRIEEEDVTLVALVEIVVFAIPNMI